jgi:hypothetical protein
VVVIELVVVMPTQDEKKSGPGKTNPAKLRWPELTLDRSDPFAPKLQPLRATNPLYALAAWTYHHADALPPALREGIFVSLERAWPQTTGRKKTRLDRGRLVALVKCRGWDAERIGRALSASEREVNELAAEYRKTWREPIENARGDHRQDDDPPHDPRPRIYADAFDPGHAEPFDPATVQGKILRPTTSAGTDWARIEQFARDDGDPETAKFLHDLHHASSLNDDERRQQPDVSLHEMIEADIKRIIARQPPQEHTNSARSEP